jgi:hypothetical protein
MYYRRCFFKRCHSYEVSFAVLRLIMYCDINVFQLSKFSEDNNSLAESEDL